MRANVILKYSEYGTAYEEPPSAGRVARGQVRRLHVRVEERVHQGLLGARRSARALDKRTHSQAPREISTHSPTTTNSPQTQQPTCKNASNYLQHLKRRSTPNTRKHTTVLSMSHQRTLALSAMRNCGRPRSASAAHGSTPPCAGDPTRSAQKADADVIGGDAVHDAEDRTWAPMSSTTEDYWSTMRDYGFIVRTRKKDEEARLR